MNNPPTRPRRRWQGSHPRPVGPLPHPRRSLATVPPTLVPPALSLAMVRTTVMVLGGNNSFPVRRDSLAKLRRSRSRLLQAPVFLSYETTSQDGRKSGGVVQGLLHIDIQELLLLLLLQAAASILLFLLLAISLAGRRCCCLGLGFHCSVCRYCCCSIVWCLVPRNSF